MWESKVKNRFEREEEEMGIKREVSEKAVRKWGDILCEMEVEQRGEKME